MTLSFVFLGRWTWYFAGSYAEFWRSKNMYFLRRPMRLFILMEGFADSAWSFLLEIFRLKLLGDIVIVISGIRRFQEIG